MIALSADFAIHFNGPPIDGPFQLYNALKRIDLGQRVGVDFQFFHGPGEPYLHYPLYRLFGGGFFASELTRQVLSTILFSLTFLVVFYTWTRSLAASARLALGAACFTILSRSDATYLAANSMIGVRSTVPLLMGAVLASSMTLRVRVVLSGLLIGLGLLFSTEQGLAMIVGWTLASMMRGAVRSERKRAAADWISGVGIGAAVYVVTLLIIGGAHGLAGAVRYAFVTIPQDQFWYFGGPPNRFLHDLRQIFGVATMPSRLVVIAIGVGVALRRAWTHRAENNPQAFAEGYLAWYALFSMISIFGTLVAVYLQPALRVAVIILLLALHRAGTAPGSRFREKLGRFGRLYPWREGVVVGVLVALLAYMRGAAMLVVLKAPLHAIVAHHGGVKQDLSSGWATHLAKGQTLLKAVPDSIPRDRRLWSTYATIIEVDAKMVHPSFDYIIHALGPKHRREYLSTFLATRPALVQTIRPTNTIYEEWLEDNSWEFYREVFRSYHIVDQSEWAFFWKRNDSTFDDQPHVIAEGPIQPAQPGVAMSINAPEGAVTLLEVELTYHVENPWRKLPFFGSTPRYIVDVKGAANFSPISLAPYETTRRFPLVLKGPSKILLGFSTKSLLPGARLVVEKARFTELAVAPGNVAWLRDFTNPFRQPPTLDFY